MPDKSVICAPSLMTHSINIAAPEKSYWGQYFSYRTGKHLDVVDEDYLIRYLGEKSAGDRRNLFYLRFIQEEKEKNQYITFGRVEHVENLGAKSAYCSSKVFVYALSKNKEFLIFFKRYDNNVAV